MVNFRISKDSPLPLHVQLLDELRHKIVTGQLKPHDMLPGEWEFVETLHISRATLQRAWQAAREEGLIYRVAGKGTFVAERTKPSSGLSTAAFIIPEYRGTFAMNLLTGAEQVLRKQGHHLLFASTDRDLAEENRLLADFAHQHVQGIILVPVRGALQNRVLTSGEINVPIVLMDRPVNGVVLPCVSSNNYAGGLQAMNHLIALGHRRILFVARPHMDLWSVSERYRAYQDALHLQGLDPEPPFLIGGDAEMSSYEAYATADSAEIAPLIHRLKSKTRPTAIFAVNDWMAVRVQRAIADAGLQNPQDVSVVGFDDLDIAQYQTPPLTTIAQNGQLMGAEAARRLITLMEGDANREILTLLPTTFVERSSTAPPVGTSVLRPE
jgi:GntR family transcriptional regulator of arabinose operon